MKKHFLRSLIMTALVAVSFSSYSQFPEWSYANIGTDSVLWNGVSWGLMDPDWDENLKAPGKLTLDLIYYPSFDMESQDVSDVWDMISSDAAPLNNYILDEGADEPEKRSPDNAEDFTGEIKGIYDDENVYILVKVTDNEIIPGQEAMELMWASYKDTLSVERWPNVPHATTDANEHVIARWGEMGAGKAAVNLDFADTLGISVESGFYFAENDEGNYTHTWTAPDWDTELGMWVGQFKQTSNTTWEAIWKFNIDKTFAGLIEGNEEEEFSFDFKVIDRDTLTQARRIEAGFNSDINEVWWSTYYAGYAKFGVKNVAVDQNLASGAIRIFPNPASEYVEFTETLKSARIYDITGSLIHESFDVNHINLEGFSNGVYFINMRNAKGTISVARLVVQK
jgi:hypothetical protein